MDVTFIRLCPGNRPAADVHHDVLQCASFGLGSSVSVSTNTKYTNPKYIGTP